MNENFERKRIKNESLLLYDLEISTRLYQFLKNSLNISFLNELTQKTETEIMQTKGFNQSYLKELNNLLKEKGISLKEDS